VSGYCPKKVRLQPVFSDLRHNPPMDRLLPCLLCALLLALCGLPAAQAQDPAEPSGGASAEVEESDDAYRRRMELEDARQRDLGYTLPPETYAAKQEKLDKLPEESRDNIRDQLVDIIVENGDWQPSDALKEYPYEPTAAAQADPELLQQEQEAWDEQIDKYHKREAAAFGTYLGPVPGPGNPDGAEGQQQQGQGSEGSEQGSGEQGAGAESAQGEQDGAEGSEEAEAGAAGTYEPYQPNRGKSEEAVSTAGVQQSALDFLKTLQGQGQPATGAAAAGAGQPGRTDPAETASATATESAAAAEASQQAAAEASQQAEAAAEAAAEDPAAQAESADETIEIDLSTPGIIAIEDLEKLEGTATPEPSDEP
jgi:hypothetical protein